MKQASIGKRGLVIAALAFGLLLMVPSARAEDAVTVTTSMKGHRFQPAELHAPAGKPIMIVVRNLDPAPAEFESNMLRVKSRHRRRHDHAANPPAGARPLPFFRRLPSGNRRLSGGQVKRLGAVEWRVKTEQNWLRMAIFKP
jgi:hypothetical protein